MFYLKKKCVSNIFFMDAFRRGQSAARTVQDIWFVSNNNVIVIGIGLPTESFENGVWDLEDIPCSGFR